MIVLIKEGGTLFSVSSSPYRRGEIERGAALLLNALLGGGNKGAITTSPFIKGD